MAPLPHVCVLRGDFTSRATRDAVSAALAAARGGGSGGGGGGAAAADVVLSDLAHSFTGSASLDADRQLRLAWEALAFSRATLAAGGRLVVKVRQAAELRLFVDAVRTQFGRVAQAKPPASRADSAEAFVVGVGFARAPWSGAAKQALLAHGVEPGE